MLWPLPTSWKQTATSVLEQHAASKRRGKSKKTSLNDQDTIGEFQRVTLREKFYQIIGHHYARVLRHHVVHHTTKKAPTWKEYMELLGIDESQLGRWKQEKTFIKSENFFAYCLLIANKPVREIELPSNGLMIQDALDSIFRHLKRTYDLGDETSTTPEQRRRLLWLMNQMSQRPDLTFNPNDRTITVSENDSALVALVEQYLTNMTFSHRPSDADLERLRLHILKESREILTNWGLTYSLFVLGQRSSWVALKELL